MDNHRTLTNLGNCFTCPNRQHSEWKELGAGELQQIVDANRCRKFLPGDVLFHQGDASLGVYCIHSGVVGIRKVDIEGNSMLLSLAHPRETLGYRALLTGSEHTVSAEVLKEGFVCFIGKKTIRCLIDQNPTLGHRFLGRAIKDLEDAEDKLMKGMMLSVRARVVHLLLVLKDQHTKAVKDNKSLVLELPLARKDLAEMIGIRPETLSRAIRQLEEDGVAEFSGRTVRVADISCLINELGGDESF